MYDFIVIGGGIVGLATASCLAQRFPGKSILLLEKEPTFAAHQTGRNSGVIHSGLYYKPGSFKALFATRGNDSMAEFCRQHGIDFDICGKLVVATKPEELPQLERLYDRGLQNGLKVARLTPEEAKQIEPHVRCVAALRVPSTGIVSYRQVCSALLDQLRAQGGEARFDCEALEILNRPDGVVIRTKEGEFLGRFIVNCGGLHSDRLARRDATAVFEQQAKIVPFRGEYYELKPEKRYLVKHLIYPVPNPEFPFLGVHFTRMIDGSIHAGPNAVLSFKREGYTHTSFDLRDSLETMFYPGFWRLARKHWRDGAQEMVRSFSKKAFVRSLQELIPEVQEGDVVPSAAGVRAQALQSNGALVDDFLLVKGRRSVHVCNAPSPAATASLEIARTIADQVSSQSVQ
jgi:(S)-2-hydroxyglutarate dehydrogenase